MADESTTNTSPDGNEANASTNDILNTLRHDPFPGGKAPEAKADTKDKGKAKAKPAEKPADSKAAEPKTGGGNQADGGATSSQPATGTPSDPEKEALRESVKNATALIEALKSGSKEPKSGGKAPSGTAQPSEAESAEPKYDFNIPDQLVQALTTDDPQVFKQGVAGFAKGIGMGVHREVTKYIESQLPKMMEKIVPQMIQNHLQTFNSRKAIFDDFYGTYKELNNPTLYPVIANITATTMQELKTDKWSPAVRDTVAKKVKELLGGIVGQVPANGNDSKLPKHPQLGGGNNSRGPVETKNDVASDIMDTLFTGFGN
jgi:hypothetical protein